VDVTPSVYPGDKGDAVRSVHTDSRAT
jgi:hypothetical protein